MRNGVKATLMQWLERGNNWCEKTMVPVYATRELMSETSAGVTIVPVRNVTVTDRGVVPNLHDCAPWQRGDLMGSVIGFFHNDAPFRLESMKRALQTGDADGMRRAAQTLKWTSANLGATELSDCCKQLEQAVRERDIDTSTDRWLVLRIESLLGAVLSALGTESKDMAA